MYVCTYIHNNNNTYRKGEKVAKRRVMTVPLGR